ncbi:MBL fold metallo-hydrolase [Pseudoalteromonas sp.]|uniref:MBL fold metallo-hydrolase n=1 Tax=Pseudoalteromonas sp. TaxID=53249 RepID=UPI003563DC1A
MKSVRGLLTLTTYLLLLKTGYFAGAAQAAMTWQTINPNIQFLKQPDTLRFYDSNQVLIQGNKCALLVDASGNFAAVEQLVRELKQRLTTPLCYLVATHFHDDHLLGMAVLQHFYPNAQLITHQQVNTDFALYQQALATKFDGFEKSIELSYQRLATLPDDEQAQWRIKLERAKQRLFRWQKYSLNSPDISISNSKTLNLGDFAVTLNAQQAHTNGDLTVTTNNGRILIAGDIADWLPYPGHGELNNWQAVLKRYINDTKLQQIIPGHGKLLTKTQLQQPLLFLTTITEHVNNHPQQSIEQLMLSFPQHVMRAYQQQTLDAKSSNLFLQAGLQRAKKAH